jgi:hypothetical protein
MIEGTGTFHQRNVRSYPVNPRRFSPWKAAVFGVLMFSGLMALVLFLVCRWAVACLPESGAEATYACTVYYTPKESGFSKEAGFDMTPEIIPSAPGRTFPADFLKAVRMEGAGRLKKQVQGKKYLAYAGTWKLLDHPLGNRGNPLEPMRSAAIASTGRAWKNGDWILIRSEDLPLRFRNTVWRVDDSGSGVGKRELDLYCGEDDPAGPGADLLRPACRNLGRVKEVKVSAVSEKILLRLILDISHRLGL